MCCSTNDFFWFSCVLLYLDHFLFSKLEWYTLGYWSRVLPPACPDIYASLYKCIQLALYVINSIVDPLHLIWGLFFFVRTVSSLRGLHHKCSLRWAMAYTYSLQVSWFFRFSSFSSVLLLFIFEMALNADATFLFLRHKSSSCLKRNRYLSRIWMTSLLRDYLPGGPTVL